MNPIKQFNSTNLKNLKNQSQAEPCISESSNHFSKSLENKSPTYINSRSHISSECSSLASYPSSLTASQRLFTQRNNSQISLDRQALHQLGLDKHGIMLRSIYEEAAKKGYLFDDREDPSFTPTEPSVILRLSENDYAAYPTFDDNSGSLLNAARSMRVEALLNMKTYTISAILSRCNPTVAYIELKPEYRIQVLDRISDLYRARLNQHAAFIRSENCLIVWSENAQSIIDHATKISNDLINFVWDGTHRIVDSAAALEKLKEHEDIEKGHKYTNKRRIRYLLHPVSMCLSFLLTCLIIGLYTKDLVAQIRTDNNMIRLFLLLVLPYSMFISYFFYIQIISNILMLIGPISQKKSNSLFFSCYPSERMTASLPHITIQCPVYKESLVNVIDPTIRSVRKAIRTYELQGGSASIFVNDDGLQCIDEENARIRKEYYLDNNIGWVARPPHKQDGYVRAGRFKKASNMNFCLNVARKVEERLASIQRHEKWNRDDEERAYEKILSDLQEEDKRIWAGGNICMGDIILLLDSDSRVPEDCLMDAASEFYNSPELGILQHSSQVMHVVNNYWEDLIAFFTELVYFAIEMTCSNGDVAAFVGHNAFLRYSALEECAIRDEEENYVYYWSENHVSEDFELSIKMHHHGYIVRLANYSVGFQEGVSLTVNDEISRWQKYAYGCSELVFNPLKDWWRHGPFTSMLKTFIFSNITLFSKVSILAYIGSYFAIAAAWFATLLDFFLSGWLVIYLDKTYLSSWKVVLAVFVVFLLLGSIGYLVARYRTGQTPLLKAAKEGIICVIPLAIFLGGLSFHVSMAIISHLLSIDMEWGATAKELDESNFFKEMPKVLKNYKGMYIVMTTMLIGTVICMTPLVPYHYQVVSISVRVPILLVISMHLISPIALNPQIMKFTF